jgi:hypothetical protein
LRNILSAAAGAHAQKIWRQATALLAKLMTAEAGKFFAQERLRLLFRKSTQRLRS